MYDDIMNRSDNALRHDPQSHSNLMIIPAPFHSYAITFSKNYISSMGKVWFLTPKSANKKLTKILKKTNSKMKFK